MGDPGPHPLPQQQMGKSSTTKNKNYEANRVTVKIRLSLLNISLLFGKGRERRFLRPSAAPQVPQGSWGGHISLPMLFSKLSIFFKSMCLTIGLIS